jgi:hypothetical protein
MQPEEPTGDTPVPAEAQPLPPPSPLPVEPLAPDDGGGIEGIPVLGWAVGWGKAIALGIKDTAEDMLDEGRRASRQAYDEGWREFDAKTRYRRKKS